MPEINWKQLCHEALEGFTLDVLPPNMQLPALPHAVAAFLEKAGNENAEISSLARIIDTDTGLTLELLRHVNSAFVGLRTKARTVVQAITLLGIRQVKMFLITVGMRAAVQSKKSKLINQQCFWNFTLQKALFAREVAVLLKADPEIAFAGALLQDYLLPILTTDLYEKYTDFLDTRSQSQQMLSEFETERIGFDHALAGAALALRWRLPEELICCILYHHQGLGILAHPELGRTPVAATALSALLPDQLRQCFFGLEQLLLLQEKWPAFNLDKIVATVDKKHEELGLGTRNDFPLSRRCKPALDKQIAPSHDGMLLTARA